MKTIRHFSTLFYYDGPQVFEARDADNRRYVVVLVDADSIGGERYLVTAVAPERLRRFRSGGLDLRSLLVESNREERYVATADAGLDQPLHLEELTVPIEDCGLLPDSEFLLHDRSPNIDGQIERAEADRGRLAGRKGQGSIPGGSRLASRRLRPPRSGRRTETVSLSDGSRWSSSRVVIGLSGGYA